ncbi:DNA-binding protein [Thermomonospora umbrina]|uniref:DNA-binding protein n=1 Tax=Thermomonospora umbrina TaxID=111806 RepID=A0A3D9SQR5_9ACTN|nr:DNA-binding protein [Thermomonospora umbrina]REE96840.1 hypothetical protein DFJ69_2292 [Thermomonospora umbrina]
MSENDEAVELLLAGAVLPPGTEGARERAVPLTARAYRHPALEDRVVVRLVAAELGAAEDLAAGFLGLEPAGEPEVVGLGMRASLGFPEWVLVHHPEDGHHALAVVPELEHTARRIKSKPQAALEAYLELAERLAASVPHFLPTFYEQAARRFLAVENATYASRMFTRARQAEVEYGLPLDEERLDTVFLEFALAGALPVKALSGYAKELAARVSADEALRRFVRLCVRRTAGGLPPSAQMAGDLRRLARAAGRDAAEVELEYVAEMLALPATARAPMGWWKGHRAVVVTLAERRPEVRGALLRLMPESDDGMPALWLEILEASGAAVALVDPDAVPEESRPEDGSAGWLERFLSFCGSGWRSNPTPPALYPLVERMGGRLRAELSEGDRAMAVPRDVDMLDLLLAMNVPVADPVEGLALTLEAWATGEDRRDLVALAADPRFRPTFHRGADRISDDHHGHRTLRALADSPGGCPMLTEWVGEVARRSIAAGLPGLPDALERLGWLPGEVLALAEDEVRAAANADLALITARTLRTGLFDELSWPAWEDAATSLVARKDVDDIVVAEAWPYLVVAGPGQARVLAAEGTVLTHDLRIPADDLSGDPGFHYVDDELLVYWSSRRSGHSLRGYWHTAADKIQSMESAGGVRGTRMDWYRADETVSLPLPGGGRATGGGVLHRGDTVVPPQSPIISDGTSFWVWAWDRHDETGRGWHEYDPTSGRRGRKGMPGFLADALRDAPAGAEFVDGRVLPVPFTEATPVGAPVDGLLGHRIVRLPDGTFRRENLAGDTVTVPSGVRAGIVFMPGDGTPRTVVHRHYRLEMIDPEGVVTAIVQTDKAPGPFAEGTAILPPINYWHCLRPRDPQGSAALRHIDRDTVAALLKAAVSGDEDLPGTVRTLLPQITHEALRVGVAGVVEYAAVQQALLDSTAERLERALSGDVAEEGPAGPTDKLLNGALSGLRGSDYTWWYGAEHETNVFGQLRVLARAPADEETEAPAGALHLDGAPLPWSRVEWAPLLDGWTAVLYRAVTAVIPQEHRETLERLLREFDALGLLTATEPGRWRRLRVHLDRAVLTTSTGEWREGHRYGVLTLGGGAFLAMIGQEQTETGIEFTTLFHDPAGRFDVPAPYTVRSWDPISVSEDGRQPVALLAEAAERGPAPWFPEAADEFARLTGVTLTTARLVVAGMPFGGSGERNFLPPEIRTTLGVKVADASFARAELYRLDEGVRRSVVGALLPAEPARLWTDGPDVAAAAATWNRLVGKRVAVPEELMVEASAAVRTGWQAGLSLPAVLDPANAPELERDMAWTVRGDRVAPEIENDTGFTATTLIGAVAMTAWLAHRLPAGDPLRAALPDTLTAVRARLANPKLMLGFERYINLPQFRKVAGAPTETGEGFERYGAVVLPTHDNLPYPGIRTALLDTAGGDPYLPVLRGEAKGPFPAELALRTAHDPRFAALLADPGEPASGERGPDGTWWPQNPALSVPDLVAEAAERHGLGEDAAVLYLMLLAMPDPTDRTTARWTGWKPARLKAARAELSATDLVVEARRTRAGRSLFLPGGWTPAKAPRLPMEEWKLPLYDLAEGEAAPLGVVVPAEPVADLYRRAWRRIREDDTPRYAELQVRRGRRR